ALAAIEAPPTAIPEAPERGDTYTVQAGDTLMGIALEFGVPMAAIQLVNDLGTETTVWVDQLLTLPQGENWANASPFWAVYEVMAGDTLSEIAARYDLGVGDLLTANGLSDGDLITVGQPLVLPIDGPVAAVAEAPSTVPEAPPPDTPATATPPTEVVASTEGVQAGPAGEPADLGTPAPAATATPVPPPEDGPVEPVSPPDTGDPNHLAALADEIFRRINDQRAAYGLPPLAWDDTLARAAQLHANDCYARGWCSHTGSDGSTYRERIIRAGYDPVRWSECWAWYATPEMAVAMWMDEVPPNDPHRRTILSDYLVEVGVGVVPGSSHGYYFIADFGTSRTP
ncbi:MAG: LysM peptidoglycan-binding domain-containing protein, partial [Anaerolineae bacterium]|nr:LysM peptidoglycan-binding domain-containing protein [Anaerolineae bacterium]